MRTIFKFGILAEGPETFLPGNGLTSVRYHVVFSRIVTLHNLLITLPHLSTAPTHQQPFFLPTSTLFLKSAQTKDSSFSREKGSFGLVWALADFRLFGSTLRVQSLFSLNYFNPLLETCTMPHSSCSAPAENSDQLQQFLVR